MGQPDDATEASAKETQRHNHHELRASNGRKGGQVCGWAAHTMCPPSVLTVAELTSGITIHKGSKMHPRNQLSVYFAIIAHASGVNLARPPSLPPDHYPGPCVEGLDLDLWAQGGERVGGLPQTPLRLPEEGTPVLLRQRQRQPSSHPPQPSSHLSRGTSRRSTIPCDPTSMNK